jgi:NitT/TauT family transport system substrate-binding protein
MRLPSVLGWIAIAAAVATAGCAGPRPSLLVGSVAWPGYEPMYLGRSLGYYGKYRIRLIDFSTGSEVARAYRDRLIDAAALTADEAMAAVQGQAGHRVVLVFDTSNGGDAVVARPGIESLQDLKGRRVGVETTAMGTYVLARALDRAGLSDGDLSVVQLPLSEHDTAFSKPGIDALVTFEPHRSRLLQAGARVLFDSSQIPHEVVDVLVVRPGLAAQQEKALGGLVAGWMRAVAYLKQNPADAAARMAPREGVSPAQFLESLKGLEIPDRETHLRLLGQSPESLDGPMRQLAAVMVRHRIVTGPLDPLALDDRYVRDARP